VCGDPAMNISGVVIMSVGVIPKNDVGTCWSECPQYVASRAHSEIERHQFDHDREGRIVTVALRDLNSGEAGTGIEPVIVLRDVFPVCNL
jgi:hypothetical protein